MKKCHNDVRLLNKRAKHLENPKMEMQLLILGNDIISPLFVSHDGNADLRGDEYILPGKSSYIELFELMNHIPGNNNNMFLLFQYRNKRTLYKQ